jgi:hypothetical protein
MGQPKETINMFKKTIATMVAAMVIFGGIGMTSVKAASAPTAQEIIPVIVNGQKVKFPDTEPYVDENGRTMVPVRFVSEMLGADVKWDNETRTAIIKTSDKNIIMTIGSKTPTVNGQAIELDTAAAMVEGRTMVPLRFVSEALDSKVTWDKGANAVQVSDTAYQAKIENGTVKLDAWGRELATADAKWNKLTDMPEYVYGLDNPSSTSNKDFIEQFGSKWADKAHVDMWAGKVRKYYQAQLNVDYRTIDEDEFVSALVSNMGLDKFGTSGSKEAAIGYVAWVKKNHVIAKGYADPENSLVGVNSHGPVFMTHFKFMIVKADDTAQTFMDNWDVSSGSDSFKLKTGVWYDGYSSLTMGSNFAREQEEHFGLIANENMFVKGRYKYTEVK